MKYVKMLGLLAVALMALAGTASATTVTSSAGTTPTIEATSSNLTLHNAVGTISCESRLKLVIEKHGAGTAASGKISSLTFTPCTGGSMHNSTIKGGSLSITATSGGNGTVTWSGGTWMTTMFGIECGYTTEGTSIGTLTAAEHAVLDITATIKRTEGSGGIFCGSTANWTGTYKFVSPTNLSIDP